MAAPAKAAAPAEGKEEAGDVQLGYVGSACYNPLLEAKKESLRNAGQGGAGLRADSFGSGSVTVTVQMSDKGGAPRAAGASWMSETTAADKDKKGAAGDKKDAPAKDPEAPAASAPPAANPAVKPAEGVVQALSVLSYVLGAVGACFSIFAVLLVVYMPGLEIAQSDHPVNNKFRVVLFYLSNGMFFFVFGLAAAALCVLDGSALGAIVAVRNNFGFFTTWSGRAAFFIGSGAYCSAVSCQSFARPDMSFSECWSKGALSQAYLIIGFFSMSFGAAAVAGHFLMPGVLPVFEAPAEREGTWLDRLAAAASVGMSLTGTRMFLEMVTNAGNDFHLLETMYRLPLAMMLWLCGYASLMSSLETSKFGQFMGFLDTGVTRGPFYVTAGLFVFGTFFYQQEANHMDAADVLCWLCGMLCFAVGVLIMLKHVLACKF